MSLDLLSALVIFAFVTSITPGPTNLMLLASGANFGVRLTLPHMLGVIIGHAFMVFLVGVGVAGIFATYPITYDVLKILSIIYMLFLAWKIGTAAGIGKIKNSGVPMTFLQAALFQWVNPKAYAIALTAVAVYAPEQTITAALQVSAVFCVVNLPSVGVWVILGQQMRRLLTTTFRLRAFNLVMSTLLVLSLVPVLVPW